MPMSKELAQERGLFLEGIGQPAFVEAYDVFIGRQTCNHDRAARIVAYFMVRAGHPTMDRCTQCWPVPCSKDSPGAEVVKSHPEETGGRVDVISGYICTVERLEREASSVPRLPTGVCGQPMGCAGRRGKRRSHVGAGRTSS